MVKHKTVPKKGSKAGYAASIEPRVSDSSDDSIPVTSKKNVATILQTKRSTPKKNAPAREAEVRHRKAKPGTKALREIKKLQNTTNLLIPRAPFLRLIRELIQQRSPHGNIKVTEMAVEAMREASECLLTSIFEDAYLLALHAKRVTLFPRDMALLLNLRHDMLSKSVNGD